MKRRLESGQSDLPNNLPKKARLAGPGQEDPRQEDVEEKDPDVGLDIAASQGNIVAYISLVGSLFYGTEEPLFVAAKKGHTKIVEMLVNLYSMTSTPLPLGNGGEDVLHIAVAHGQLACVDQLVRMGFNVNFLDHEQTSPLHLALLKNYIDIALYLIRCGADVNARDNTGAVPLHYTEDLEVGKFLVGHGADVNAECDILYYCVESFEDFKFSVEHGADVNGENEIRCAKIFEIIKFLVENGADVNGANEIGSTPLHCAKNLEVVKLLVEHGADVNAKNDRGVTPLHYAERCEVVKFLVGHGADVNAKDNSNMTPLQNILHQVIYVDEDEINSIIHYYLLNGAILNKDDYQVMCDHWRIPDSHKLLANLACAISNICSLSGDTEELTKPDEALITEDDLAYMTRSIMTNYLVINKMGSEHASRIAQRCTASGALSEMLLGCFEESKIQAVYKILRDTRNLKAEVNTSALTLIEPGQLLKIAKEEILQHLLKNGNVVWDTANDESYQHIVALLPEDLAKDIPVYLKTLKEDSQAMIATFVHDVKKLLTSYVLPAQLKSQLEKVMTEHESYAKDGSLLGSLQHECGAGTAAPQEPILEAGDELMGSHQEDEGEYFNS